jgi:hypothetical protein
MCFDYFQIAHVGESSGYVRTWYDNDKDDGIKKSY